jgi:Protein of unknown function (DUF1553)/Protein of unknown function (DUF1549)/Planctomycete cytochrome C
MRSACCLLLCAFLGYAAAPPVGPRLPVGKVDFVRDVQPILSARCVRCHDAKKQKGGLRLDTPAALRGGTIIPGKGADSLLLKRVTALDDERMPPGGAGLTARQVGILRAWIDQGASWPESAPVAGAEHWAYRPLVRPAVPAVGDASQVRNVVDRFVQARLEKAGLRPAPEAMRAALIRRLSFDLRGLPPTPERVDAFVKDIRPDAYERLVDEMLADPAYGERYARHWLDVVHFAETHGHDQDVPRDNAWPYRDYLVRAFNADRSWGAFISQQVAGDVLDDPEGVVATGMLAAGPWDESSQQSIRDDTVDKKQAQNLDRDDMVTTVMSAFTSTTVHCARCHDHKFDPVSQEEYYALQAVFAGIDRANRPYDIDPAIHRRRREIVARRAAVANVTSADYEAVVAEWERSRTDAAWEVVALAQVVTANGSVPAKLADGSVRFGGPRPERDTYTLTLSPRLAKITALRLEVLTDDALPHKGPGRQDNGNLHLNEIRVSLVAGGRAEPIPIRAAVADFDQAGWTIGMAIDGKPGTAWGIYPAVGKPHQAVFAFARQVSLPAGGQIRVVLEQTHGGGHLIGRVRLSVTEAENPERRGVLPSEVAAISAILRGMRSAAQQTTLTKHVLLERLAIEEAALPAPGKVFAAASDFTPEGSFRPAKGCRPVFMLRRGEIAQPLRRAEAGALSCVPGLPGKFTLTRRDDEGQRRAAMARWLGDSRNVLTWRSLANRLWHHHFGRGIVSTPGDIGKMGALPSHPELLDWLACEVRDGEGLKHVHRLLVTSAAYRRAVRHDDSAAKQDADNLLLWRMNRTRLDAESVRDAVLAVSGKLDRTMGGPSVRQFAMSKGIHVTPNVNYDAFDIDSPGATRRSVYRFLFRTLPDPFFDVLDCPDASQFTPARAGSITPLQALALMNDRFMVRQAEHLAGRIAREAGHDPRAQVGRLFELALSRPPTAREIDLVGAYARKHGMPAACRIVLNENEFHFVE